jgi:hypothetical protein
MLCTLLFPQSHSSQKNKHTRPADLKREGNKYPVEIDKHQKSKSTVFVLFFSGFKRNRGNAMTSE